MKGEDAAHQAAEKARQNDFPFLYKHYSSIRAAHKIIYFILPHERKIKNNTSENLLIIYS